MAQERRGIAAGVQAALDALGGWIQSAILLVSTGIAFSGRLSLGATLALLVIAWVIITAGCFHSASGQTTNRSKILRLFGGPVIAALTLGGLYLWLDPTPTFFFKASRHLTWRDKRRISRDLSRIKEHLRAIGLTTPEIDPPVEVVTEAKGGSTGSTATLRSDTVTGVLRIHADRIDDRRATTWAYISYAVLSLSLRSVQVSGDSLSARQSAEMLLTFHLSASYWGSQGESSYGPWGEALWDIRGSCGREFTDRLAVAMLDAVQKDQGGDYNALLYRSLSAADDIVDSERGNWPTIRAALARRGIPIPP